MANFHPPVGFLLHPASPLHDTGWGHPEHQGRLRALASAVSNDLLALHDRVVQIEPGQATEEDLLRVHTPEHLASIKQAAEDAETENKLVRIDGDTIASSETWRAALGSTAALLTAVESVADGTLSSAFVATRPPGHHATPDRAMGFCFVNHVAVAARWLQAKGCAQRVLIIDWDVHHGNGTQDTFYGDGTVFYLSLHQWPHYPGTGAASDVGVGAGEGWTLNIPLSAGTPAKSYLEHFWKAVDVALDRCQPDFILISAGFDVMSGDPLGNMRLEPEDLHTLTRGLLERARGSTPVVAALEGGYDVTRTGLGVSAVLRALTGIALD